MNFFSKVIRKLCWTIFPVFPKDPQKVIFESFYGRGYSDNPKAIAEVFRKRGGFVLYWVVKDQQQAESLPEGVLPLKRDSVRSVWHYATAGVWVDNCRKFSVNKGRDQFYVQTWHGFPLKRIEKDAEGVLDENYIKSAKKDSAMCDLLLSNGSFMTNVYQGGFWYNGEILEKGFPRNDVLLSGDSAAVKRAESILKLPEDYHFILYAPTFRREMGIEVYDVDYQRCVQAFQTRFGGRWLILAKMHPNIAAKAKDMKLDPEYVRNVSDYPDIQDLYLLSQGMITDYSSVMFDYMLTGKPCFLYVNDLADYKDDRNFYYDIKELPFPCAENNQELEEAIFTFDEKGQQQRVGEFCTAFGIAETGTAAEAAVDAIIRSKKN